MKRARLYTEDLTSLKSRRIIWCKEDHPHDIYAPPYIVDRVRSGECSHYSLLWNVSRVWRSEANVMPSPLIHIKKVSMNSIKPQLVTALGYQEMIYMYKQAVACELYWRISTSESMIGKRQNVKWIRAEWILRWKLTPSHEDRRWNKVEMSVNCTPEIWIPRDLIY